MDQGIFQVDFFIPNRYAHHGKQSGAKNTQISSSTHIAGQLISRAYRSHQQCSCRVAASANFLYVAAVGLTDLFYLPSGLVPPAHFRSHDYHHPAALRRF